MLCLAKTKERYRGDLSELVNLRVARKPISDARTTTYVILSTGSGPGGRSFKSTRPNQLFCNQQFKITRIVVGRMVPGRKIESFNPLALTDLISSSHIDLHRHCFALFNAQTCPDLSITGRSNNSSKTAHARKKMFHIRACLIIRGSRNPRENANIAPCINVAGLSIFS